MPHPSRAKPLLPALLPAVLGLLLGALVLGPALGRGYVLVYDMVFVPDPAATRAMFGLAGGFPRQVPSDMVAAGLAHLLTGDVAQKALLLAIFLLAAAGAARLIPGGLGPRLAASTAYVWNPFVGERLLLGHWALLLGYAGLPWALAAAREGPARLTRALLPAAIGGFQAMDVSALVVLTGSPRRRLPAAAAVLAGLSLPWLVPALLAAGGGGSDPAGVDAFAARSDTPFGGVGSLLSLGGIWNAQVVPPGYAAWAAALGRLLLALAAIGGFVWGMRALPEVRAWGRGLAVAAGTGLVFAAFGLSAPGREALRTLIGWSPAFGVLRDAQVWVAPLALLESAGLGLLALGLTGRTGDRLGRGALAVVVAAAPVLLLPGLAWGASGRLRAVDYPADFTAVQKIVSRDGAPGKVLLLPWGAYRRYAWNRGIPLLDPLPRMFSRTAVTDDGLQVGALKLANEAPDARAVAAALAAPGPPRLSGFRYVVVEAGPDAAAARARLSGLRRVYAGPDLDLYRIDGPAGPTGRYKSRTGLVVTGDGITLGLVLWALLVTRRRKTDDGITTEGAA